MWAPKNFPQMVEASQQTDNDYVPPEKKTRGCRAQPTLKTTSDNNFLKEALDSCRNHEIGIEEASLIYGIPKRTLRAKLKDSNSSVIDENFRVFVLSSYPFEAESELVGYLQDCFSSQITMSITDVRRLAYELVCEKYKVDSLPKKKNCILGQRWYKKFIEKYPYLDVRNQALKSNEVKSIDFYNTLESFINEFRLDVSQIYSVDGIQLKFCASCVEDMKAFHKRRTIYINAKAICCMNPVGDFLPPIFLKLNNGNNVKYRKNDYPKFGLDFQEVDSQKKTRSSKDKVNNINSDSTSTTEDLLNAEKQIKMNLSKKLQPVSDESEEELREKLYEQFVQLQNKVVSKSKTSVNEISPEIFHDWFLGFINHVKPNPEKKVLLLLSDQNYIKSFKILELGRRHGVIFLVLPPHSAHRIYPLDGFAMSLNRNLSTCARRWLGKNPDFKLQQVPLQVLFMEAFTETINPLIAKSGFLYSGIWPINRDVFESRELGGESVLLANKSKLVMNDNYMLASTDVQKNNLTIAGITNEADIGKLCRVCMKEKMYMKPLLEALPSPEPNYHGMKMIEITKIPISYGDGLPLFLCQYCLVQLIDTIKIRETAVKSHKKQMKLREALDRMFFEDEESENQEFKSFFQWATTHISDSKLRNRIISKNFDINSLCRICMGEKQLMTSIFSRTPGGTIICSDICSKITEVSEFQVHIHDGLSSSICPFCRTSINKASEFIQKVLSSDMILREIMSHFKGELDIKFKTEDFN